MAAARSVAALVVAGSMRAGEMVTSRIWLRWMFSATGKAASEPAVERAQTTEISAVKSTPFHDAAGCAEFLPCGGEIGGVGDFLLSFAVVAEVGGFENAGGADAVDGVGEGGGVGDDGEIRVGELVFAEEEFFALAVLAGGDGGAGGVEAERLSMCSRKALGMFSNSTVTTLTSRRKRLRASSSK